MQDATLAASSQSSPPSRAQSMDLSASFSTQPPAKRRKSSRSEDIDELFVRSINMLQEKRKKKEELDEEGHFAHHAAGTLRRFNSRQKAIAKLRIEQVLVDVEFAQDNYFTPPVNYNEAFEFWVYCHYNN